MKEQPSIANFLPPSSRRNFLRRAGLAGAVAAVAPAAASLIMGKHDAKAVPVTDIDGAVLNFALNLEYLEAEYYLRGYTGTGIVGNGGQIDGVGNSFGNVTIKDNPRVPFQTNVIEQFLGETTKDEFNHVLFLRSTLAAAGIPFVAMPDLDFVNSFNSLYQFITNDPNVTFDAFANEATFLIGGYLFEDIGVTAYSGGSTLITNPDYLQAAANILAVEAYHAATQRLALFTLAQDPSSGERYGVDIMAISGGIANFAAYVDSTDVPKEQPFTYRDSINIVPTDDHSLVIQRTTREVLNLAYGAPGTPTSGGFFPSGFNGDIA